MSVKSGMDSEGPLILPYKQKLKRWMQVEGRKTA
jgi:hypothetical protein